MERLYFTTKARCDWLWRELLRWKFNMLKFAFKGENPSSWSIETTTPLHRTLSAAITPRDKPNPTQAKGDNETDTPATLPPLPLRSPVLSTPSALTLRIWKLRHSLTLQHLLRHPDPWHFSSPSVPLLPLDTLPDTPWHTDHSTYGYLSLRLLHTALHPLPDNSNS